MCAKYWDLLFLLIATNIPLNLLEHHVAMYGLPNAQIALFHIYCIEKTLFHMCNNVFFNGSNGTKVKISGCDNMGEFDASCSELIPSALVK